MEYDVYPRTPRNEVAPKGAFLVAMMSSAGCLLAQSEISTGGSISSRNTSILHSLKADENGAIENPKGSLRLSSKSQNA